MNFEIDLERKQRKQKIIAVYGAIVLVFLVLFVLWLTPDASCVDGRKNGLETGVDCGGTCAPCKEVIKTEDLVVEDAQFVLAQNDTYDAVAWLYNPNNVAGAKSVGGKFVFRSADGMVVGEYPMKTFLLPGERKFVIGHGITLGAPVSVSSVEWMTESVSWEDLNQITDLNLSIGNRRYQEVSDGAGFAEVSGLLTNNTPYDWDDVYVSIVLLDNKGTLLATHGTSRQTFRAGEKWDFQLPFPERFPGVVYDVKMQAETNVYDNDNFLKANLPGGSFQSLPGE